MFHGISFIKCSLYNRCFPHRECFCLWGVIRNRSTKEQRSQNEFSLSKDQIPHKRYCLCEFPHHSLFLLSSWVPILLHPHQFITHGAAPLIFFPFILEILPQPTLTITQGQFLPQCLKRKWQVIQVINNQSFLYWQYVAFLSLGAVECFSIQYCSL